MIKRYWHYFTNKINSDQFVRGSLVVFLGSIITSAINYLYHMVLGRMLGPEDYGIFSSLFSLIYIYGIPVSVLNMIVIKYISSLRAAEGDKIAVGFFYWFGDRLLKLCLIGLSLLMLIAPFLASFLHLSSVLLVIVVNIITFIGIYISFYSSFLLGFLQFGLNSLLSVTHSLLKIVTAVVLIYLGLRINGAVFSLLLTSIAVLLLTIYFVRREIDTLKKKAEKRAVPSREILKFALPVLLSSLSLTSFYTTDILLVKHLFSAKEAGLYASLALLGKIVFFASSSINLVMFPLVSGKKAKGENYRKVYLISLMLVFLVSFCLILVYFSFPQLMIKLLFGSQYLAIAPELGLFAIFMAFYSLVSLTVNFFLAVAKTTMIVLPLLGAVLQIGLIFLFHESIRQVVWVNIYVLGGLFFSLIALPVRDFIKSGSWRRFAFGVKINEKRARD